MIWFPGGSLGPSKLEIRIERIASVIPSERSDRGICVAPRTGEVNRRDFANFDVVVLYANRLVTRVGVETRCLGRCATSE